jgi:hypothetical protein
VLVHGSHRDHSAVGEAEHVRRCHAEVFDERGDIVGQQIRLQRRERQVPDRGSTRAAPAPAQIEHHHVRRVRQLRHRRQEIGVVPGRAAMHDDERRQRRIAEAADEQLHIVDAYPFPVQAPLPFAAQQVR